MADLTWLEALSLGGIRERLDIVERRSDGMILKNINESNPNQIEAIAACLAGLSRLRSLDCSGTDLQDLSPLADCSTLAGCQ